MPIYEFECPSCGHRFDRLQKLSDPDPDHCPACAAEAPRRRVSAPSFRLAGSGWYETDFKSDKDKKRNLAESGDGSAGATADSKAADSKAADSKTGDSKPTDSKPAATTTATESKPATPPPAAS